jgi:hypothetical protein
MAFAERQACRAISGRGGPIAPPLQRLGPKFFGRRCPNGDAAYNQMGRHKAQIDLAMKNLLLLLAVAVPLSCLAFLSWLALLGIMTLGAVINVVTTVKAGGRQWPGLEPAKSSIG